MLPIKFPNIRFNYFRLMAIPCLHIEVINNKKTLAKYVYWSKLVEE